MRFRAIRRHLESLFEHLAVRPLTLLVFALSVLALLVLQFGTLRGVRAPAVGAAAVLEHPSPLEQSVVEALHVQVGDEVQAGTPLLTLSSIATRQLIKELDAQILAQGALLELEKEQQTLDERSDELGLRRDLLAALRDASQARAEQRELQKQLEHLRARAETVRGQVDARSKRADELLAAELERDLSAASAERAKQLTEAARLYLEGLRGLEKPVQDASPTLAPMLAYHAALLESLRLQREGLRAQLEASTVLARGDGRVTLLLPVGSPAAYGLSVATVRPSRATELIAYVDAEAVFAAISQGSQARVVSPEGWCQQSARVVRVGAVVEQAPLQLEGILRAPVFGLPVVLEPPSDCSLAIGQPLTIEFESSKDGPRGQAVEPTP